MTLLDASILVAAEADTSTERLCCVFAQATIERWAGLPPATGELLAAWRVWDIAEPWSPPRAAVLAGVADEVADHAPLPGRWHLVQGWRRGPDVSPHDGRLDVDASGHTFLWRAASDGRGLQVDSVKDRGPAWRPRTWAEVVAEFHVGLALAVLRPPVG